MKGKKKYIFYLVIIVIIITAVGYRIYDVNKDISRKYQINEYKLNEYVQLDNLKVKVLSIKKENSKYDETYKEERIKVHANFLVQVTSKQNKDIEILTSMSSIGRTPPEEVKGDSKKINSLQVGESVNLTLTWNMSTKSSKLLDNITIYFPKDLYAKQIKEKYNQGLLYGKCIKER